MNKIFIALLISLFSLTASFAQNGAASPSNSGAAQSSNYSESSSYQPRVFEKDSKPKKDKKPKKNAEADKGATKEKSAAEDINGLPDDGVDALVKIPVFIYDRTGKPVKDLKNTDFTLLINGKEQEIAAIETTEKPLDILLIVDTSPSFSFESKSDDDQSNRMRNFTSKLIETLKPEDKVQIAQFNSTLTILNEPTSDRAVLAKVVKQFRGDNGTSLYDALQRIEQKYLISGGELRIVLLLTDAVDTTSRTATYRTSLVEAEKKNAVFFPFYIDTYVDQSKMNKNSSSSMNIPLLNTQTHRSLEEEYALGRAYLTDLAALSGGRTFVVKNLSTINKTDFEYSLKLIKPQYYLSFKPERTGVQPERKQLVVRVNRPNLIVQTRGSYIANND